MWEISRFKLMALFAAGALVLGGCGVGERPAASVSSPATESATPSATPTAKPTVTKRKVTVHRRIPYKTRKVKDPGLARGHKEIRVRGRSGIRTLTYVVTYRDGERIRKRLVRKRITRLPVTKIVAVGTKEARSCDPNYAGACVPIASDVDCAGNDGNGPAYVDGPVRVVGVDKYDLDRDGDGIACDD